PFQFGAGRVAVGRRPEVEFVDPERPFQGRRLRAVGVAPGDGLAVAAPARGPAAGAAALQPEHGRAVGHTPDERLVVVAPGAEDELAVGRQGAALGGVVVPGELDADLAGIGVHDARPAGVADAGVDQLAAVRGEVQAGHLQLLAPGLGEAL